MTIKRGNININEALNDLKIDKEIFADAYSQLKLIKPPNSYEQTHAKYLKSMELSQNATDELINMISTHSDNFNVPLKNLDEAKNLTYQANGELS